MNTAAHLLHLYWIKCSITILWGACLVFSLICFCKSIKASCIALSEDPRHHFRRRPRRRSVSRNVPDRALQFRSTGLAPAVVNSLPAVQYCKNEGGSQCDTDCAVCLGEFVEGEWLRLLPNCFHIFHAYCIDTWFLSHSNCPLCRANILNDFSFCESTISTFSLLHTQQRDDMQHCFLLGSLVQSHELHILVSRREAASSSSTTKPDMNQSLDGAGNTETGRANDIQ